MADFRRSLVLSFAQGYSDLALRLTATVVLARLLTPVEIGAFAVVAAVATIATVLCEFGIQSYLVQERELTPSRRAAAAGLTTAISLACAVAFAAAGLAATLIEASRPLAGIVLVFAPTLAMTPLTASSVGRLQREMRFDALYVVATARAATFTATAIGLAALGAGPIALAWACLAENIVAAAVCLLCAGAPPRPLFAPAAWREVVRFGAFSTANSVVRQTADAAPGLAVAQIIGLGATGLLTRAQTLLGLFDKVVIHGVAPVLLPYLSERARQGADLAPPYIAKVAILTAVAWPAFGFIALAAGSIVRVLLGSQWDAAVPIARILCLSGVILPFNVMNGSFLVALGLLPVFTRRIAVAHFAKVVLVVAAAFAGLPAVAAAIVVADFVRCLIVQPLLVRHVRYAGAALARVMLRSAAVTATALVPVILVLEFADSGTALARLAVVAPLAAIGWLIGVVVFRHPLRDELTRIRTRLRSRSVSGSSSAPAED